MYKLIVQESIRTQNSTEFTIQFFSQHIKQQLNNSRKTFIEYLIFSKEWKMKKNFKGLGVSCHDYELRNPSVQRLRRCNKSIKFQHHKINPINTQTYSNKISPKL